MRAPELIIFDNDGVLVDTEVIANHILADLLSSYGLSTTFDEAVGLYLGTSLAHVRSVAEQQLGEALPPSFEAVYHDRLFDRLAEGLDPIPGVREALAEVSVPFCVASSGSTERIERTLRAVELWDYFTGRAFSADDIGVGKPAPDLFLRAAERLGHDPAVCTVVEDSPWGIEAANAAGMTSWGFAYRTPEGRLSEATGGILSSMRQLRRVWDFDPAGPGPAS